MLTAWPLLNASLGSSSGNGDGILWGGEDGDGDGDGVLKQFC